MKTLYFECGMGAAGDMLTASLLDVLPNPRAFAEEFNGLGIPGVEMELEDVETCGIRGRRVHIRVNGHEEECPETAGHEHEHCHENHEHEHGHGDHVHRGFDDVAKIIADLPLSETVRKNAMEVYRSVAEAESKVHNKPLSEVHFHELGSMDAVADVVAFSMLIEKLNPDDICASAINVGSGHICCAHGVLPVPAPATAVLLSGIPSYGSDINGELCTPTGAALLRQFAKSFGPQPVMETENVGYGIGSKVFPKANCVRAFIGESGNGSEVIDEISCNLDDMTGEAIGFAMETLLENGALDVFTIPIGMKKSRPAVMLCCLCKCKDTERLSALMLRYTTSLGTRISQSRRITLPRKIETVETPYGPVRVKKAGGTSKPEYEDVVKIARENGMTFREIYKIIDRS